MCCIVQHGAAHVHKIKAGRFFRQAEKPGSSPEGLSHRVGMPLRSGAPGHCTSCPSFRHSGAAHGLHPHAGALHRHRPPAPRPASLPLAGRAVGVSGSARLPGSGRGTAHPVHLSGTPGHYTARITPVHPYPVSQCSARRSLTRRHSLRTDHFCPIHRKTVFQNAGADTLGEPAPRPQDEWGRSLTPQGPCQRVGVVVVGGTGLHRDHPPGTRCTFSRARCWCSVSRETLLHYITLHCYTTTLQIQYNATGHARCGLITGDGHGSESRTGKRGV
jgi:hypothetical protein